MVCAQQPKPGTNKPKLKARFPTGFCYLALALAELAPFWIAREHTTATRPPDAPGDLRRTGGGTYAGTGQSHCLVAQRLRQPAGGAGPLAAWWGPLPAPPPRPA